MLAATADDLLRLLTLFLLRAGFFNAVALRSVMGMVLGCGAAS